MSFMIVPSAVATWALVQPGPPEPGLPPQPADASPRELRVLGGRTDHSIVTPKRASPQELPTWRIPNVPPSAEAYYAPDNYHVIAQAQDPDAVRPPLRSSGALTWIFSDDGNTRWRVNDRGQDACSYFFPDSKRGALHINAGQYEPSDRKLVGSEITIHRAPSSPFCRYRWGKSQAPDQQRPLRR
jgi:hypothetical protein